jgi:hypothetical protein
MVDGKMEIDIVDGSGAVLGKHLDRGRRNQCHPAAKSYQPRCLHRAEHQDDEERQHQGEFNGRDGLPGTPELLKRLS